MSEQLQNLQESGNRPELTNLDREALRESVIQRFELAYELTWKFLKRYMTEVLGLTDVPSSPKPIFRLADQNGLLDARIEAWLTYANARINTAHDYSGEKAQATLTLLPEFLIDAQQVYRSMTSSP